MIEIGLAGWGDHDKLYAGKEMRGRHKLAMYAERFPTVEVDASYYAIQPSKNYETWSEVTPPAFSFVVKAFQGMTGHVRGGPLPPSAEAAMFREFRESIEPLVQADKLAMVLFQYPPWFDCTREHVAVLRRAKELMEGVPVALEFRNRSWFEDGMEERTLAFMEREGWIHSICDEPQAGRGSVPIVAKPTRSDLTLVRFHGRNAAGWHSSGEANWRDVRYLYRYSEAELTEWVGRLRALEAECERILVVLNNNSGGDAADNAGRLAELLGLSYGVKAGEGQEGPEQLELF